MHWKKSLGIWIMMIAIFICLVLVMLYENKPPVQNLFSQDCSSDEFMVFADSAQCEKPRTCTTNMDCDYLLIEQLPTRVGACVNGVCTATCGSGVLRECR